MRLNFQPKGTALSMSMVPYEQGGGGLPAGFPSFMDRDFGPNFDKFKITFGDELEFISDTLYDTETYAAAGQVQLPFFARGPGATIDLTNLPLGNMIPDRQGFLVMSIRVYPLVIPRSIARSASGLAQASGALVDMLSILNTGTLSFNFLNKDYGTFPLWLMPAGAGANAVIALEGATGDPGAGIDFATNGIPDARNMYILEQPLFLPPMTKLGVVARWPVALATTAAIPLKVLFDGLMVRPVQ